MKKNKNFMLFTGILFLISGLLGFLSGYNSVQQWRQSFSIIGFILTLTIFVVTIIAYFKKSDSKE
ncbi:MAG: hypothetical protein IPP43_04875 [Chitinophagaceae bacterium]|nr:hypothetical protein [Chitinophagaceae bacterium]MBK9569423.1 hypothetical protein [Chitinophagaceae bacterium]MBL0130519.1 hypothetical protein [Chitinophagaceae bacterium]MBL0273645.1 hypothetical protein [Chitinophagaceae bacterium]